MNASFCSPPSDECACIRSSVHAEPLNPVDRAMRSVDCSIRWLGYPGFETQMLIWLAERLDAAQLQIVLNELALVEPLIVSRLKEPQGGVSAWHPTGAQPALIETMLRTDTEQAVLDYAATQLSTSADPAASDPVRFHLIHRPRSGDVFMMQYNHTLMDNRGSIGLVRAIDRLAQRKHSAIAAVSYPAADPMRSYLRRYPRDRRRATARRAVYEWWKTIQGGAARLGEPGRAPPSAQRLRILTARLGQEQTQAFRSATIDACGFPATSMAILASVFRALDRLAGDRCGERSWVAGIGIDLNLRGPETSVLHNLMSIVPVRAARRELSRPAELLRRLNDQMRRHLENEIDLGMLQLIARFARQPQRMRWIVDHCLAHGFSLWYAYFGSLDVLGTTFLGVPIEDVSYVGPCWSPIGVTVLAQQYQGRLALQITFVPELVSDADARKLSDMIQTDLRREKMLRAIVGSPD